MKYKYYFDIDTTVNFVSFSTKNICNLGENFLLPKSPIKITDTYIKYDTYIWL